MVNLMKTEVQDHLRRILTGQRVLSLGVLVNGAPYVGMLPFALRPDFSALLVHASSLARHSRGLTDGAPFSALVQVSDHPELEPLALPRVTLDGTVRTLARQTADYDSGRRLYQARFPSSARTFALGDFSLYELVPETGRFVAGFGSAHTVTAKILAQLAAAGEPS